jgi:DNA helicase-2/ATP-dependent DNA helicase PcrA
LVRDEADQARYVAERVLASREEGVDLKAQAVLFRASDASAQLELELVRRDIPFVKFGGLKFLESSHVKDLLGALRWMQNPRDRVAGFRTLQLLPGLGPAKATKILDAADAGGLDWAQRRKLRVTSGRNSSILRWAARRGRRLSSASSRGTTPS